MNHPSWNDLADHLATLHRAALDAADPGAAVTRHLRLEDGTLHAGLHAFTLGPGDRVKLLAIGKASPGMARAALGVLRARVTAGVIAHPHATDPGNGWPEGFSLVGAGHPIPDDGSLAAGAAVLAALDGGRPGDLVVVLVSGGGSALCEALRPGLTLADLQETTRALQHAGADIVALNTVRRALSRIKGGGLARAAAPARVVALLLSDVMGDTPEAIASGPTVPSPTGAREALAVLGRLGLTERLAPAAAALLAAEREAAPSAAVSAHVVVGSNRLAAEALRAEAGRLGFHAAILTHHLQGEAREAGRVVGGIARSMRDAGYPIGAPGCAILGGETTVTVRGNGHGGRNQELALGAALALDGVARAAVFSFATDGVDGPTEAAGAIARGDTVSRAGALGLSPHRALADNDAEPFFRALDDLWITGPSGTNVNDLAVALVYP